MMSLHFFFLPCSVDVESATYKIFFSLQGLMRCTARCCEQEHDIENSVLSTQPVWWQNTKHFPLKYVLRIKIKFHRNCGFKLQWRPFAVLRQAGEAVGGLLMLTYANRCTLARQENTLTTMFLLCKFSHQSFLLRRRQVLKNFQGKSQNFMRVLYTNVTCLIKRVGVFIFVSFILK